MAAGRYLGSAGGKLALVVLLGYGLVAAMRAVTGAKKDRRRQEGKMPEELLPPGYAAPHAENGSLASAAFAAPSGTANGSSRPEARHYPVRPPSHVDSTYLQP